MSAKGAQTGTGASPLPAGSPPTSLRPTILGAYEGDRREGSSALLCTSDVETGRASSGADSASDWLGALVMIRRPGAGLRNGEPTRRT